MSVLDKCGVFVLVSCLSKRGVCHGEVSVLDKCGEVSVLVSCLS